MCNGGELLEKINELGHFNEKLAANIMYQILRAVSYCHLLGIVHRDLKPDNIILEYNPNLPISYTNNFFIKLIDFGCSKNNVKNIILSEEVGTVIIFIKPAILHSTWST